jgi:arsenate reductase-like glutaredoxin family protein
MKRLPYFLICLFVLFQAYAQEQPIKIVAEEIPNRLAFYAINENDQAFDVKLTITGTNFRQSRATPRFIRVPAISKVHMKTIILMRGKKPSYTYDLAVNDSLSKRALRKPAVKIKIRPKKQIVVYIPKSCLSCDSLISPLNEGPYKFTFHNLGEQPEIAEQLNRSLANSIVLDSLETPIVNLGGRLYTRIETYDQLIEALEKE